MDENSDSILEPILESPSDLPVIGNDTLIENQIFESVIENSQSSVNSQNSDTSETQSQSVFECETENSQNNGKKECPFEMIQGKRRDKTILHSISENQLYVRNKVLANGSIAYTW